MPDLPRLLASVPDDWKPFVSLAVGSLILVSLVMLHGGSIHGVLALHKRNGRRLLRERPHLVMTLFLFGWTVFLMLALHILGVMIWAFALIHLGFIPHPYDAIYFCANAYTTLGYGNVDLGMHWRLIAPIIGISGLFTFAWTTGALVQVVSVHSQLVDQMEAKRDEELKLRSKLRADVWSNLAREKLAERAEDDKFRTRMAGASFFGLFQIWREERRGVKELRRATVGQIKELRREEFEQEEKLSDSAQSKKPEDKH